MYYKITFYSEKPLTDEQLSELWNLDSKYDIQNLYVANSEEEPEQFI